MHLLKRYRTLSRVILAGLVFLPLLSYGSIFWKRSQTMCESFVKASGARTEVYVSKVRINGAPGDLSVVACEESSASVEMWLKKKFGLDSKGQMSAGQSVSYVFTSDKHVSRVVLLDLGVMSQSMVFWITQTLDDYEKSAVAPSNSALTDLPIMSGSSLLMSLADEGRGPVLEIMRVSAGQLEAGRFYEENLLTRGWGKLLNEGNVGSPLKAYSRGNSTLFVQVKGCRYNNESFITVLHNSELLR